MLTDTTRTLKEVDLLTDLEPEALERIAQQCRWIRCKAGHEIVKAGGESREVFFIVEGRVQIVNYSFAGREVVYASLDAGQCFGELAALDGRPRSASVVAEKPCLLAVMPSERFVDLLRNRVEVTFKVLQHLTSIVRSGDIRIMELSTLAASQRVYSELLRLAVPDAAVPQLWIVRPLPPLREIASRVSTTRETAARALGHLYSADIIRRKGRNLYIMDRARLEEVIADIEARHRAGQRARSEADSLTSV